MSEGKTRRAQHPFPLAKCSPALLLLPDGRKTICTFRNSLCCAWMCSGELLPQCWAAVAQREQWVWCSQLLVLLVLGTAPAWPRCPGSALLVTHGVTGALGWPIAHRQWSITVNVVLSSLQHCDRFQEPEPASGGCRSCCSTDSCHGHPMPQHPCAPHSSEHSLGECSHPKPPTRAPASASAHG